MYHMDNTLLTAPNRLEGLLFFRLHIFVTAVLQRCPIAAHPASSPGQGKPVNEWPLKDARSRFSAVVDAAIAGDPQRVTRRDKPAVVVLAVEEYERLRHLEKAQAPMFADVLLAIPQDDEGFERLSLPPRPAP